MTTIQTQARDISTTLHKILDDADHTIDRGEAKELASELKTAQDQLRGYVGIEQDENAASYLAIRLNGIVDALEAAATHADGPLKVDDVANMVREDLKAADEIAAKPEHHAEATPSTDPSDRGDAAS